MHTPYANRTTDELIRQVYAEEHADPLMIELAQRLEEALNEIDYLEEQM